MTLCAIVLSSLFILLNSALPATFSNPVLIVNPSSQGYNHP